MTSPRDDRHDRIDEFVAQWNDETTTVKQLAATYHMNERAVTSLATALRRMGFALRRRPKGPTVRVQPDRFRAVWNDPRHPSIQDVADALCLSPLTVKQLAYLARRDGDPLVDRRSFNRKGGHQHRGPRDA